MTDSGNEADGPKRMREEVPAHPENGPSGSQRARLISAVAVTLLVWITLVPRMVTNGDIDQGTFRSVAERLIAGDTLYIGVWDNKEPLFFYSLALARSVSPLLASVIDVAWIAIACLGNYLICRWRGCSLARSVLVGGALTVVILTGTLYFPGMTHVPGTAVGILAVALLLRDRWLAAGFLAGIVLTLKITAAPVVLLIGATILIARRQWRGLGRTALGAILSTAATVLVLALRDELGGFVKATVLNVAYSQHRGASSILTTVWENLGATMRDTVVGAGALTSLATICVILLVTWRPGPRPLESSGLLWLATASSLIGALVVICLTGVSYIHAQGLYLPAVLAMTLVASSGPLLSLPRVQAALVMAVTAYLLGGVLYPQKVTSAWEDAPRHAVMWAGDSAEAEAMADVAAHGTYQRLGRADTTAHARGLAGWTLSCPKFHQYSIDPPAVYADALACLDTSDVVIVDSGFTRLGDRTAWNDYHEKAMSKLERQYDCREESFGQLCVRKG